MHRDRTSDRAPGRHSSADSLGGSPLAPGKQTLTEGLAVPRIEATAPVADAATPAPLPAPASGGSPVATVQMLFGVPRAAAPDKDQVHTAAASGISTPASGLPHADQIQRAFGRHDISGVRAHTGPGALASAREMGARAYATGDHVVLGEGADLHTTAHEAAHIIQQRNGIQPRDGVGEVGDAHERQADEVASLVVQGKSAESVLGDHATASSGSTTGAVQRQKSLSKGQQVTVDGVGIGTIMSVDGKPGEETGYMVDIGELWVNYPESQVHALTNAPQYHPLQQPFYPPQQPFYPPQQQMFYPQQQPFYPPQQQMFHPQQQMFYPQQQPFYPPQQQMFHPQQQMFHPQQQMFHVPPQSQMYSPTEEQQPLPPHVELSGGLVTVQLGDKNFHLDTHTSRRHIYSRYDKISEKNADKVLWKGQNKTTFFPKTVGGKGDPGIKDHLKRLALLINKDIGWKYTGKPENWHNYEQDITQDGIMYSVYLNVDRAVIVGGYPLHEGTNQENILDID